MVCGFSGGSVDYRMSDRLTYRIIQPEVLTTVGHFYPGRGAIVDANLRVSSGLIFRFANR